MSYLLLKDVIQQLPVLYLVSQLIIFSLLAKNYLALVPDLAAVVEVDLAAAEQVDLALGVLVGTFGVGVGVVGVEGFAGLKHTFQV